jgi:hypothetical protein
LDKVSNFSNETLIFADFFINVDFFFSRRVVRILPRGKNRRGKTVEPLCSLLFLWHFFFKKSAKISVSLKKAVFPNFVYVLYVGTFEYFEQYGMSCIGKHELSYTTAPLQSEK